MKILSAAAATLVAFFLPSRSRAVDIGKLALIGMAFTTFFLFVAGYHFPGGASHYPNWADAIAKGETLTPDVAQREVGLPLLYILSGWTIVKSFIGITLIYALLAVLTPLLVYWAIMRASPAVAFMMALVCIFSLAPYTYIKFFYPDQFYMFINLLAITLLIEFFWTSQFRYLYFFTLAAILASFTRTAGNLMYPVLMSIAYITARGPVRQYAACALIFVLSAGAYQWHRYEIFDVRNQPSAPSGKGMQILYSTYLYLGDFGYRLSPDIGPNTKRLFELMRAELKPTVRDAPLIQRGVGDSPPEFMEKYFYALTPEQLIEKIATEPNEEYYWNVIYAVDSNDQFFLDISKEIARKYPFYVAKYAARNMWHALFDPGYATTRYNTMGYIKTGGEFPPSSQGWGVRSEDAVTQYGMRAAREMEFFQFKTMAPAIQEFVTTLEILYIENFHAYVWVTAVPMVFAWICAFCGVFCWGFPRLRLCHSLKAAECEKLMAPVIAASALLVYEDLATSLFSQPVYRYFHMTEPWRLVVAGYGLVYMLRLTTPLWQSRAMSAALSQPKRLVTVVHSGDLLNSRFALRPRQWAGGLIVLNLALFGWWASSVIAHTSGPAIEVISASYGQSCARADAGKRNVTDAVRKLCLFTSCKVTVDDKSLADPAPGCAKDFQVAYRCHGDREPRMASIAGDATGKTVDLDCYLPPPANLRIVSATYGESCRSYPQKPGASYWVSEGNVTQRVQETCRARGYDDRCSFIVDNLKWGDPAQGCGKDFSVTFECKGDSEPHTVKLPAEAAQKRVDVSCLKK